MIRLYIDWNVISQMKSGNHAELSDIISDDNKFLKFFSTSHIGDIAASDQSGSNRANIESDLKFIEKITNGWCVYNNAANVVFEKRSPSELYDERTELKDILKFFQPGGLKEMISGLELDPEASERIASIFQQLEDLQTGDAFKEAFDNPQTQQALRQFFPEIEHSSGLMGIFNSVLSMFSRLNETDDYKHMRTYLQKGINLNRDKVFDAKEPYRLINRAYENFEITLPEIADDNKHGPKWFSDLSNEYIKLDMHGYQEDKVSVGKGRKQTFRNTMEDAFHAAFATTCDFYITNDERNFKKSEAVYEKMQINSLVMKPDGFIRHYNDWLHHDAKRFLVIISGVLKYWEPIVSQDGKQKTYFGYFFIFDYFNKIYQFDDSEKYLVLSRERPTNGRILFIDEVSTLIDKLIEILGEDMEKLGRFQDEEIDLTREGKWQGRTWNYQQLFYNLILMNGYLQLYITGTERKHRT